jgi:phosphoribosylformylglycinamidine cyclo-ligase
MDVIRTDRDGLDAGGSYRRAGVDEEREQVALRRVMLPWFEKTRTAGGTASVLGVAAGHFATLVRLGSATSVALTTDGVGTKILVARAAGRYDSVGIDCVANNVNDLVCIGARPLVLLDYIAIDRIDEEVLGELARGLSEGAQQAGIEIAGGEIAQVEALLAPAEGGPPMFDLVGMALGVLPAGGDGALDGSAVGDGDVVLALPSSGLHSNGYSLARRVLLEEAALPLDAAVPGSGRSLADELLEPTRIYVSAIQALHDEGVELHGLVNITGGGLLNLTRLHTDVTYVLTGLPEEPPIFRLIRERGGLGRAEMLATFNMGVGICIVLPERAAERAAGVLESRGERPLVLGRVVADGRNRVDLPADGLTGSGEAFEELPPRDPA